MSPHAHVRCLHVPCSRRWPMLMPSGTWQSPWAREMLSRTSRKNPGKSNINIRKLPLSKVLFLRRDKYKAFMERCVEGDTAESYIVQARWGRWEAAEDHKKTFARLRRRSREAPTSPLLCSTWTRQSRLAMTRPLSTPEAGSKLFC